MTFASITWKYHVYRKKRWPFRLAPHCKHFLSCVTVACMAWYVFVHRWGGPPSWPSRTVLLFNRLNSKTLGTEVKLPGWGHNGCADWNKSEIPTHQKCRINTCGIAAHDLHVTESAARRGGEQLQRKGQTSWNLSKVWVCNICCCLTRQPSQICIYRFNVHSTELFRQGENKHLYTILQRWRRTGQPVPLWHPGSK